MENLIRVIHADDHAIVRNGFRSVFETDAPYIQIVGEASNYEQLYSVLVETPADILLLDGVMPGGTTSDDLPIIRNLYPNLKILLLWMFANENSLTKWIHLLDGQLTIGCTNKEDIIYAIGELMKGEKYFVLPIPRSSKKI